MDITHLLGFIAPSTADVATAAIQKERKIYRRHDITHICWKGKYFAPPIERETKINWKAKMTTVTPISDGRLHVTQGDIGETWIAKEITRKFRMDDQGFRKASLAQLTGYTY